VLRASLKQTLTRSPSLNGHPAAGRVSPTTWRECFAGVVIIPAGTSQRAKLRPRATVSQPARLLLPRPSHAVWRCDRPWFTVDQSRDHQPLHDITADKRLWDTLARPANKRGTTRSRYIMDRTQSPYRYRRSRSAKALIVLLCMEEYCLRDMFHLFNTREKKSRFLCLTGASPAALRALTVSLAGAKPTRAGIPAGEMSGC
jgi:hypothetical protein